MNKAAKTLMIMLCLALSVQVNAAGPVTKTLSATVSGTTSLPVAGACSDPNPPGYSNQCAEGPCFCYTATAAGGNAAKVSGGLAGKGTADVYVTADTGNVVPTTGLPHYCDPIYGQMELTTTFKKAAQAETISLLATSCHHPAGQKGKPDTTTGGFGIESATNGAVGWGTFSGTFDPNTNAFKFILKGSITQ
jgi:hypothetical protein